MRTLYAGPFIGEFGWQLFGWQGVVRQFSANFDETIVTGPPGHEFLYKDFMTAYVDYPIKNGEPNMWANDKANVISPLENTGDVWMPPQQLTLMRNAPEQTFIFYGKKKKGLGYDILYHARDIGKYGSDYINYPKEKWLELFENLKDKSIAAVGTKDGAMHIEGTEDLRGISLEKLADVYSSSKILIGPSSGPMHFAALCGIPIVVWSGYERSKVRYEIAWNPFQIPTKVISDKNNSWDKKEQWHPEVNEIFESVDVMI